MKFEPERILSPASLDALVRAHDGDCALLALWMAHTSFCDPERAAGDLCMTRSQVDAAMEKLGRILSSVHEGYFPSVQTVQEDTGKRPGAADDSAAPVKVILPAQELPEYTAEEICSFSEKDDAFQAVLDCARLVIGRDLNTRELGRLLGMYHHLGLPADVLFVLLHYCEEISRGPQGAPRAPTVSFIEKQAYQWVNQGITSVEAAEDYAERQRMLHDGEGRIRRVLEIYDRNLTASERSYIDSWLTMGFDEDCIALAYERTLDNIGKRQFPYIGKILQRWHEAGIHTVKDVREKEPSRKDGNGAASGKRPAAGKRQKPDFEPTPFD